MKKLKLILLFFPVLIGSSHAQNKVDSFNYASLDKTHDITLPAWGPYTKKYMGISHIADSNKGIRFDLSVMPGFYRQKVLVPNVLYESGYYPWNASADLNYFSFREELEWKDQVFTDVAFAPFDENSRLVQITCTNHTPDYQNLVVHLVESLQYPEINPTQVSLPGDSKWINAIDYKNLQFAKPRPQDNLTYDGWVKGEVRKNEMIGGSGLGKNFGKDKGDIVAYEFQVNTDKENAWLFIRYKVTTDSPAIFISSGIYKDTIVFKKSLNETGIWLNTGKLSKGLHELQLTSIGAAPIELEGFTILDQQDPGSIKYAVSFNPVPAIIHVPRSKDVLLKYSDIPNYYGVSWDHDFSEIRQFYNDQLDVALPLCVNNHTDKVFYGNDKGHYTDVFLRPVPLQPRQIKILYALVSSGTKQEIESSLKKFHRQTDCSIYFKKYITEINYLPVNPAGLRYILGEQIIKANTLQNVVFPVYTNRKYIKHFTPGRWWNSLYTWDAGFIGLGMANIDTRKAIEILNAYTTSAEDSNAFVHHGSMVPVQFFLLQDLWNKTQSRQLLAYFYPRLKKYYLFYAGHAGNSTMRMGKSGLIRPWDYFYNSGGWDDYPPQKYISNTPYTANTTPVINTSMAIRAAKILSIAAHKLGETEDLKIYDEDIKVFEKGLQTYSWDKASGYFGYVIHDSADRPSQILRTTKGINFNMGMDGAYPLLSGICTKQQQQALLSHLFSNKGCWSRVGLSAVDQSAPYYDKTGYWNGTVWFPHQWFFWKTMLDLGQGDRAAQISTTALETWKKETALTYHSVEHFSIETARGAGWHQFSALSTPLIMWFHSYYHPGTLTTGFDGWVENCHFSENNTKLNATIYFTPTINEPDILVCMKAGKPYKVFINGVEVKYKETIKGLLQVKILKSEGSRVTLKVISK